MSNVKDCSTCKYCNEDFVFDEKTGERPLAMVFENYHGKTYIRKLLKDDEALELHKLLTE